jgi:hypothetical protein
LEARHCQEASATQPPSRKRAFVGSGLRAFEHREVRGRSRRRISIAALTCYKPGHCSRLIYRPRRGDGRRDGRKSFSRRDYRDLLIAAHQQLGGPIVLV